MDDYKFEIDETNIHTEFAQAAGMVAWYGGQLSLAKRGKEVEKLRYEETLASVRLTIRETEKSAKVAEVDAMVTLHPDVSAARMVMIEAEAGYESARWNFSAALAKKDMLVSLGAHLRAEMDNSTVQIKEKWVR